MRLVESLTKFADHSSIHGLTYIAKSPSKTERIIWFILFTIALFYAAQQISEDLRGMNQIPPNILNTFNPFDTNLFFDA